MEKKTKQRLAVVVVAVFLCTLQCRLLLLVIKREIPLKVEAPTSIGLSFDDLFNAAPIDWIDDIPQRRIDEVKFIKFLRFHCCLMLDVDGTTNLNRF